MAAKATWPRGGERRSIRLRDFDYSSPGPYFVTICVNAHRRLLNATDLQKRVQEAWNWLRDRFPGLVQEEFVIMPDHVHFVVRLSDRDDRRGGHPAAQGAQPRAPTLGNVVGAFKTVTARAINEERGTRGARVWQRNYFEHVIRDEAELARIREYIRNNPLAQHDHERGDPTSAWEADRGNVPGPQP